MIPEPIHHVDEINALEQYFSELDESQLRYLFSAAEYETFPPGRVLTQQGEKGDRAFILLEGEVEILLSHQGRERVVGVRAGGHILGEMALLEDKPRAATLVTKTEVRAFVLQKKSFHNLLLAQPELSLAINRSLSARMRATQDAIFGQLMEEIASLEKRLQEAEARLQECQQSQ